MIDCRHKALFRGQDVKWEHWRVELRAEKLTGGLPAHEDLFDAWMSSRNAKPQTPPAVAQLTGEPVDRVADQAARVATLKETEETIEHHSIVFARDTQGHPAYEGRCFMGGIKEAANILKNQFKVKNFRNKVVERIFVCERFCTLNRRVKFEERPISVMTRQGPRTSLKRAEVAEDVNISFTLHIMADGIVKPTYLEQIIQYGCLNGWGADRSQGSGRCEFIDLVRID